jgi:hypothetical protein
LFFRPSNHLPADKGGWSRRLPCLRQRSLQ